MRGIKNQCINSDNVCVKVFLNIWKQLSYKMINKSGCLEFLGKCVS